MSPEDGWTSGQMFLDLQLGVLTGWRRSTWTDTKMGRGEDPGGGSDPQNTDLEEEGGGAALQWEWRGRGENVKTAASLTPKDRR